MTAIASRRATAFLRRAYLLAGILAIVAGILGMHIMTGTHTMPASAIGHDTGALHAVQAAPDHPGHVAVITEVPAASAEQSLTRPPGPWCGDACGCTMMSAMDGSCVPSPGSTTLAAPLPGTTTLPTAGGTNAATPAGGYAYLPGSPSPGQLSISRT
jgi:hypothetical protein